MPHTVSVCVCVCVCVCKRVHVYEYQWKQERRRRRILKKSKIQSLSLWRCKNLMKPDMDRTEIDPLSVCRGRLVV